MIDMKYRDGKLSISIEEADIKSVLKKIEGVVGVKIDINEGIEGKIKIFSFLAHHFVIFKFKINLISFLKIVHFRLYKRGPQKAFVIKISIIFVISSVLKDFSKLADIACKYCFCTVFENKKYGI